MMKKASLYNPISYVRDDGKITDWAVDGKIFFI